MLVFILSALVDVASRNAVVISWAIGGVVAWYLADLLLMRFRRL